VTTIDTNTRVAGADNFSRILELDGLRAVLAFWVVLVHVAKTVYDVHDLPFADVIFSELMRVKMFFMISGMVVVAMLLAKRPAYMPFMAGRLRRIYPAYLAALILSIATLPVTIAALNGIPFDTPGNGARERILEATQDNWFLHGVSHLTMLHGVVPTNLLRDAEYAFIGQAWNISTEFQFYVIAPLLVWAIMQRGWVLAGALATAFVVAVLGHFYPNNANLGAATLYFAIGVSSYFVIRYQTVIFSTRFRRMGFIAAASIASIALFAFEPAISAWIVFLSLVMPFYLNLTKVRPLALFASRPMRWLGTLSYSIYLSHMVVMFSVVVLLNQVDLSAATYFVILMTATVIGATGLAYLINRYVEVPFARSSLSPQAQTA
jgi:peptidoglycan/LPS O-acetylase OafA/YrhL